MDASISLTHPGRELTTADDESLLHYLETDLATIATFLNAKPSQFFGAHPVSLTREAKRQVELAPHQYFVCEKSDGVRYILIVLNDKKCLLTSRKGGKTGGIQFFEVQLADLSIPEKYGEGKDYELIYEMLDGQLVQQRGQLRFLIFDTMAHQGKDIHKMCYFERLYCGQKFIRMNKMFKGLQKEKEEKISTQSIRVLLKDFFVYSSVRFLLDHYIPKLKHANDGLIITKNQWTYTAGSCHQLLKWKPSQMNTIDFLILPNDRINRDHSSSYIVYDLYVKQSSKELQTYADLFFDFMFLDPVASKHFEQQLEQAREHSEEPISGLVGECNRVEIKQAELRNLSIKLVENCTVADVLSRTVLTEFCEEEGQEALVQKMMGRAGKWGWGLERVREDKGTGNNVKVANNIMQTVVECIKKEQFK